MTNEPSTKSKTLAFTALAGLLTGLPACASAPPVTEVPAVPTEPGAAGGETTTGDAVSTETGVDAAPDENAQAVAADPGSPDEAVDPPKHKHKHKKKPAQVASPTPASMKSCCAGKNDCKGLGGCKTAQNSCMGKNMCKGQGGCKTGLCQP
jgi:hypothetical protein